MKRYELMWIIGGILDDKSVEESLSNVTKSISLPKKCKVIKAELWAKRKLSYEIGNFEEGTYFLADLESEPESISQIENILKENEAVIRHLVTIKEKFKPYKVNTK
ncbi:MAG: 30S ribosomal protein S6 [Chloroflexota bacterium]|nr:30S ribosomal protein S6 [Chloroflexota bacterium]